MKIIAPTVEINEYQNDLFNRQRFGDGLTNLIKNCADPLVIGLNGNWGEGKSTFVKMWQSRATNEGMATIYIDAFENDYTDDAFMVVASAIHDWVDSNADESITNSFLVKAKKAGRKLIPWTAKIALKGLTLGAIKNADLEDAADILEEVSSDISDATEKLIHDKLKSHKEDVDTIRSFKEFLSSLPSKINKEHPQLTIIIDELDRCRPSFAVEMLEKIKHLFSVPNITFLLVMNKTQLHESIRASYGTNIDAHTYLQKFINIEAQLPKHIDRYGGDIRNYCEHLHESHEFKVNSNNLTSDMVALGIHFDLTLRQLERIYTSMAIAYSTFQNPKQEFHSAMALCATIKVVRPNTFARLVRQNLSYGDFISDFGYDPTSEIDESGALYSMTNVVRYCLLTEAEYRAQQDDPELIRFTAWHSGSRFNLIGRVVYPLAVFS